MEIYDVAIIGYGPVGATLANLLGQAGKKVVIFEKESSVYHIPRASHLDGEIMRVYQSVGLAEEIVANTISAKGYRFLNSNGQLLTQLIRREGAGPQGWNYHYRFHQPVFETILRRGVSRFNNVDSLLLHEVTSVIQNEDYVSIEATNLQNGSTINTRAKYAIGCDGARSLVGAMMGTTKDDIGLHQPWLVVDIKLKHEVDLPDVGIQYCEPERPTTFIPYIGEKDRFRWELYVMPGETKEELEKPEKVWEILKRWVKPEDAILERASVYTFHSTITKEWRKKRLLLAGDSAHQMPPFLGQGMCAGIRDASNLAWKLISVLDDRANEDLLDTYQIERENHVRDYTDLATNLGGIIAELDVEKAQIRDESMLANSQSTIEDPSPKLGLGLQVDEEKPVGTIFPQPILENGQLLDDVIGGLKFAIIGNSKLINSMTSDTKNRLQQLNTVVISADSVLQQWLADNEAQAVIIRPDRYILGIAKNSEELQQITALLPSKKSIKEVIN